NETGYGEGRKIEYPFADNRLEQLEPLAADLIARNVAVIAAGGGNNSALVAQRLTSTIPDPFPQRPPPRQGWACCPGLVSSFNRPGANVTGVSLVLGRAREQAPRGAQRARPADLSDAAGAHRCWLPARRRCGHHGAPDRSMALGAARSAVHHREP